MGYTSYNASLRANRAATMDYAAAPVTKLFKQNVERKIHESMNPKGVLIRECRDSKEHPNATPIIFGLDVTGSMGHIPHQMIKDGLPTLMSALTQNGVPDAALMFVAVGDHECDRAPLQVAQFESGDAELDMWLTRTWLEGNGGGNAGESYLLAWYFAAYHTGTDAWDKRKEKGFVITIGDEPCLRNLPAEAVREIMGDTTRAQGTMTAFELLAAAQEKYHVFHIHLNHGRTCDPMWKQMLGSNLIEIDDHRATARTISDIVLSKVTKTVQADNNAQPTSPANNGTQPTTNGSSPSDIML